jgi:hypothetical protein
MNGNQDNSRGARGGAECGSQFSSVRNVRQEICDKEQTRRDQFNEAVRQVLARQAEGAKKKRGRELEEVDCRKLLTPSELQFLLKKES